LPAALLPRCLDCFCLDLQRLAFIDHGIVYPHPGYLVCYHVKDFARAQIEAIDAYPPIGKGLVQLVVYPEQFCVVDFMADKKDTVAALPTRNLGVAQSLFRLGDVYHGQNDVAVGKGFSEAIHGFGWLLLFCWLNPLLRCAIVLDDGGSPGCTATERLLDAAG
jgi:hypothetical protein